MVGRTLDVLGQFLLVGRGSVGLPVEFIRVGAVVDRHVGRQRAGAIGGDAGGGPGTLGQRRQGEPALLCRLGVRGEAVEFGLGLGDLPGEFVAAVHGLGDPVLELAAHALGVREFPPAGDQVIGRQTECGVPQVRLDGLGAPGHLGLPPERLELAAQLGGEVSQPVEIALHPGQLALGLLLASPVFEDARGLLDERAPLLGLGLQDLGELALADDHVHLAADAGVRQQLLDVHEPCPVAVDLVLARTVSVHAPGERDLGVVDRQCPVGVVQGQRHLGTAERLFADGAGEDHVLHLPAAQRLGAVLTHHPGERVHDVRLAGAVGPHDRADAGFESQGRGRREGLEALERQRLEIHGY